MRKYTFLQPILLSEIRKPLSEIYEFILSKICNLVLCKT